MPAKGGFGQAPLHSVADPDPDAGIPEGRHAAVDLAGVEGGDDFVEGHSLAPAIDPANAMHGIAGGLQPTARPRTSGENLFVVLLVMAPPSQELEPPTNPRRFKMLLNDTPTVQPTRSSRGCLVGTATAPCCDVDHVSEVSLPKGQDATSGHWAEAGRFNRARA